MGIWVGRYAIVDGVVREHGPWLVDRRRVRDDEDIRLLVLAEPVDYNSAPFCTEVAEAVAALFAQETLSVTGGLLRALQQAHANLAEWNRRSLREHQVAVGITCVAVRDIEATIAQAGPGAAYAEGPRGLRALRAEADAGPPLGGEQEITPTLTTVSLRDTRLLLLTSTVARELRAGTVEAALAAGQEEAIGELYRHTRGFGDMTAVLIAEGEDASPEPPAFTLPPVEAMPEAASPSARGTRPGVSPASRVPRRAEVSTSSHRDLPRLRSASGMRAGLARRSPRVIGIGVLALAVVLLLAVCTLPSLLEEDRGAQFDDAVRMAQQHLDQGAAARDSAGSRQALQAAVADIARARSIRPEDPALAPLQQRADQALAALDAVVDLPAGALRRVLSFEGTITAPFMPATLVAGGDVLWVLDGQRGRVFRVDPSGAAAPDEAYRSGATYGDTAAREPRALAWDAAGSRLLIVDAGGNLFALGVSGAPRSVPLRGGRDLGAVSAVAAYRDNLYLLDPPRGEVWRYLPGGTGFDSERAGLLHGAKIGDARGLAIDGDLYVLTPDGVRRFGTDRELGPMLQGIDRPVSSAAALAADPVRHVLYVADRGNHRIVVGDHEGLYLRQYRHPQLFDLRGLALSQNGETVYVLTGDGIYAFSPAG